MLKGWLAFSYGTGNFTTAAPVKTEKEAIESAEGVNDEGMYVLLKVTEIKDLDFPRKAKVSAAKEI